MTQRLVCKWIENLSTNVGQTGFSIRVATEQGRRCFKLRAEAISERVARELGAIDLKNIPEGFLRDASGRPATITVSMELPISFCPHCGADLEEWIRMNPQVFEELAASQYSLDTPDQ